MLHASEEYTLTKVKINGDRVLNGIFDLSVEYGDDGVGWMAYSRVSLPEFVSTHLAKSIDNGKSWDYISTINKSYAQKITALGKTFNGVWRYETPSLMYDPDDIPERKWKLFVQKYYAFPPYKVGNSLFSEGWIEYKTANSPNGPWSKPKCLFGHKKHGCEIQLNSLHPSLAKNLFYNEIGSFSYMGVLYISVDASTTLNGLKQWRKRTVVLFSSRDHGKSWHYNGVLTNYQDASKFGYLALTGSSLVLHKDKPYLLITPSGKKGLFVKDRGHNGCYVVAFDDIKNAKLAKDSKGRLRLIKNIAPGYHSGGLCDYHEANTNGGVLFSQINLESKPDVFGIYNTGWMPY